MAVDSPTYSPGAAAWRRLRANPWALTGLGVVLLWVVLAVFAPLVAPDGTPHANRQLLPLAKLAPGDTAWVVQHPNPMYVKTGFWSKMLNGAPEPYLYTPVCRGCPLPAGKSLRKLSFPLGTDTFGRCTLSRLLWGARISLSTGFAAVLVSLLLGATAGMAAGYFGGRADAAISWVMTVVWALPGMLLAVAIAFSLGRGLVQLFLSVGLSIWVDLARVVRAQTMGLRQQDYVLAAQVLGYSTPRILLRHLLPALGGTIIILCTANFATAVLLEAGLSFLGLGISPPAPSWGSMVYEGFPLLFQEKGRWLALLPGFAIVLLILCINMAAMGIKEALQPEQKR